MAETIRINDIPVIASANFTDNDLFLIVDDGKARLLQRPTLQAWIRENVQGEKGDTGQAGRDGVDGAIARDGVNGTDGLSAYQVAVKNGYIGSEAQWLATLKGATGASGVNGINGWSPVITSVPRGNDVVLRLTNWIGGTGNPPTIIGYLSETGIVTNIANATNVRGLQGIQGVEGQRGVQGEAGQDGAQASSIKIQLDQSVLVTYTNGETISSNTAPRITGWMSYKDGQYNDTAPFTVPQNTTSIVPNNSGTIIENGKPVNVVNFYDKVTQKCTMIDPAGLYSVRVKFKVSPSNSADRLAISFSKNTTESPYTEDRTLRGDNQIQDMNFSTVIYGDTALQSNGMTVSIRTFNRAVSIYNIEFTISKLI